jgi:uncharacterized protein (TIGR03067 family)
MMQKTCLAVALMLMVGAMSLAQEKQTKKKSLRPRALIGQWTYVSGKRAGEDVGTDSLVGTVTITKETFTLPAGPDSEFVMKYELDTSKDPAQIDLEIKSGPIPEGSTVGIVKVAKGKLTLCYDPMGQTRPEEFSSTEDNGAFLFVLQKKKEKKKKKE